MNGLITQKIKMGDGRMRANIAKLVVGLFLIFGFACIGVNYVIKEIHPVYDLQTGLTALATYGVILIVNGELMKYSDKSYEGTNTLREKRIAFVSYFGAFVGINLLAIPLIYIVLNSEFFEGISGGVIYVLLSLIVPIVLPQVKTLSNFVLDLLGVENEKDEDKVIAVFSTFYAGPTIWLLMNHRPTQGIVTIYLFIMGSLLLIIWDISRQISKNRG